MIFKRNQPEKAGRADAAASAPAPRSNADPAIPLPAAELRRTVDPASLGFKTTAELEPISGLIGQDRALKAIQFGTKFKAHDFNLFVLGPAASGKRTAVKQYLTKIAKDAPAPADWVYVNNFDNPNRPRALKLPPGRARPFAKAMIAAIDELRTTLPAMFEGEDYQARRRAIDEGYRSGQEQAFEALNQRAQTQNIAVLRTPQGFAMAPMHEGKVVKPEVYNTLPEAMRKEVEGRIEALQKELELILEKVPKSDKERRGRTADLNADVASHAVGAALDDIMAAFANETAVHEFLQAAAQDLVRNAGLFLSTGGEESVLGIGRRGAVERHVTGGRQCRKLGCRSSFAQCRRRLRNRAAVFVVSRRTGWRTPCRWTGQGCHDPAAAVCAGSGRAGVARGMGQAASPDRHLVRSHVDCDCRLCGFLRRGRAALLDQSRWPGLAMAGRRDRAAPDHSPCRGLAPRQRAQA